VVRDRRRIDPNTGEVRAAHDQGEPATEPAEPEAAPGAAPDGTPDAVPDAVPDAAAALQAQLDERTQDLQRITAEYANYRKRVERDREAVVSTAKAQVVLELLGVLDDLERAEAHGDLTGAFRAVADKVGGALQKVGLQPYGHEGDEFDPSLHEAVQHSTSPDVSGPTVTAVLRRGYRFGERVLRTAMVGVTDHEPAPAGTAQPGTDGPASDS
jgi:molecular chaperone GrpE